MQLAAGSTLRASSVSSTPLTSQHALTLHAARDSALEAVAGPRACAEEEAHACAWEEYARVAVEALACALALAGAAF